MLDGATIYDLIKNEIEAKIYLIHPFGDIKKDGIAVKIIGFDRVCLIVSYEKVNTLKSTETKTVLIPLRNICGIVPLERDLHLDVKEE